MWPVPGPLLLVILLALVRPTRPGPGIGFGPAALAVVRNASTPAHEVVWTYASRHNEPLVLNWHYYLNQAEPTIRPIYVQLVNATPLSMGCMAVVTFNVPGAQKYEQGVVFGTKLWGALMRVKMYITSTLLLLGYTSVYLDTDVIATRPWLAAMRQAVEGVDLGLGIHSSEYNAGVMYTRPSPATLQLFAAHSSNFNVLTYQGKTQHWNFTVRSNDQGITTHRLSFMESLGYKKVWFKCPLSKCWSDPDPASLVHFNRMPPAAKGLPKYANKARKMRQLGYWHPVACNASRPRDGRQGADSDPGENLVAASAPADAAEPD